MSTIEPNVFRYKHKGTDKVMQALLSLVCRSFLRKEFYFYLNKRPSCYQITTENYIKIGHIFKIYISWYHGIFLPAKWTNEMMSDWLLRLRNKFPIVMRFRNIYIVIIFGPFFAYLKWWLTIMNLFVWTPRWCDVIVS